MEAYSDLLRLEPHAGEVPSSEKPAEHGEICWIVAARLRDSGGEVRHRFRTGETLCLEIEGRFSEDFTGTPALGVSVVRGDGTVVYTTATSMDGFVPAETPTGTRRATLILEDCPLMPGRYAFHVYATDQHYLRAYDTAREVERFEITDTAPDLGLVRLKHRWR